MNNSLAKYAENAKKKLKNTLRALRLCVKNNSLAKKKSEKPFAYFASLREIKMSRQERGERKEEKLKKPFACFA